MDDGLLKSTKRLQKQRRQIKDAALHAKAVLDVIGPTPKGVKESDSYQALNEQIEKKKGEYTKKFA